MECTKKFLPTRQIYFVVFLEAFDTLETVERLEEIRFEEMVPANLATILRSTGGLERVDIEVGGRFVMVFVGAKSFLGLGGEGFSTFFTCFGGERDLVEAVRVTAFRLLFEFVVVFVPWFSSASCLVDEVEGSRDCGGGTLLFEGGGAEFAESVEEGLVLDLEPFSNNKGF